MTDDLVKRLLDIASPLADEAAGQIHRLTAERDRLAKALQVYADPCDATETTTCGYEGNMCCRTAREALKGETP